VLFLWVVLAVLSVGSMAAPALAADVVLAPRAEVLRQDWGLPLTIAELAGLVVVVVPLVIGCVQAAKPFGVKGKASFALALGLGLVIGGLVVAASLGILPPWAGIAIVIVLGGLLAGLAATGIYDLQSKNVKANEALVGQLEWLAQELHGPGTAKRDNVDAQRLHDERMLATARRLYEELENEDDTRAQPAPQPTFGGVDEAPFPPPGHGVQGGG